MNSLKLAQPSTTVQLIKTFIRTSGHKSNTKDQILTASERCILLTIAQCLIHLEKIHLQLIWEYLISVKYIKQSLKITHTEEAIEANNRRLDSQMMLC